MNGPGPDLSVPHRLILVRHGQTPHTTAGLVSGAGARPEPELDAEGLQQARRAAERLARLEPIDEVLASPMLRAQQTAAIIAHRIGADPVTTAPDWAEAHFGQWEGMSVAEILASSPGAWEAIMRDPQAAPPQGESLAALRQRVHRAWTAALSPARTTLVVTHLTPIRAVIGEALGIPTASFARILAAPGSISIIDRWADGGAAVITVGERPVVV